MKLRDYLSSKAITLSFLGMGGLLFCGLALFFSAPPLPILLFSFLFLLLTAVWLTVDFLLARRRLSRLEELADSLPQKYLLGELLPPPRNPAEAGCFLVMKTVAASAVSLTEEALREKEEYVSYVESWIHEMKTPLTACSLILANGGPPGKLKAELKRADNLTESILYYARLRSTEKDRQLSRFFVAGAIREAVEDQMSLLIAAGTGVETEGDFPVIGDRKSLVFIFKQLLINSAKYCPGCKITITARGGDLTFSDNGVGIPAHELPRVTERGFTGEAGRARGGSTGMGLYLVRILCEQEGIALSIDSRPGVYTTLRFTFADLTEL